ARADDGGRRHRPAGGCDVRPGGLRPGAARHGRPQGARQARRPRSLTVLVGRAPRSGRSSLSRPRNGHGVLMSERAEVTVQDNPEKSRYEAVDETGVVAGYTEYHPDGDDVLIFPHTVVEDAFEGRGVGS